MNELLKSFGYNAGKIYDTLQTDGPQVQTKLLKKTQLRDDEFHGALGWLARENKICKKKRTYKLGETNLTPLIGINAGKIWDILRANREIDISGLSRSTKIEKNDCYAALGWLAREGKITAKTLVKRR